MRCSRSDGLGGVLESLAGGLRTLVCGIFLYALGGYIRKFNPFERLRGWILIAIPMMVYSLIYVTYYNVTQRNIRSYLINAALKEAKGENVDDFIQSVFGFGNYEIVPLVLAVVMFEVFRRIHIPNNKVINILGAGTFMTYLIHDNGFWYDIWKERNWIKTLHNTPLIFCWKLIKWSSFIFAVGIATYIAYIGIMKICEKCKGIVIKENKETSTSIENPYM